MKINLLNKVGCAVCVATVFIASQSLAAVDQAANAAKLADISTVSTLAKGAVAQAAASGDTEAIAEATKRADAIDAALESAQEAYSACERALESGDEAAAAAAVENLDAALAVAKDALSGVVADSAPEEEAAGKSGGPGEAGDPPNIYDVPWQTDSMRSFCQGLFGTAWSASSQGGFGYAERDATPE